MPNIDRCDACLNQGFRLLTLGRPPVRGRGRDPGGSAEPRYVSSMCRSLFLSVWLCGVMAALPCAEWPCFRGDPAMSGASETILKLPLKRLWRSELSSAPGTPAVAGGRVLIGAQDKKLRCLDLANGTVQWTYPAGHSLSAAPLVTEGLVVIGDNGGWLHAVACDTGALRWKTEIGGQIAAGANRYGSTLVVGSYANDVLGLALADGAVQWRIATDAQVYASVAISGRHGAIAGCDGKLRLLDLAQGREIAQADLGTMTGGTSAMRDGRMLIATMEGTWWALVEADTKVLWKGRADKHTFLASPALAAKHALLFSREGALICLDPADGKLRWRKDFSQGGDASPLICGDNAVIADSDGLVRLVSLADGAERWRFATGSTIAASPVLGDGRLLICAQDGGVYCFAGAP